MDFFQIKEKYPKKGIIEISPSFEVTRSKDLMVRGKSFYAIWDEEKGLWSTDEYDVQRLVDKELVDYKRELEERRIDSFIEIKFMKDFSTKSWIEFRKYMSNISDSSHQLDERLTFLNTEVKKKDYVSKRLPYALEEGDCNAYDELIRTLYTDEERAKLEWAIGAIVSGDSRDIQKFVVLYGEAGTGKSTILNVIQKLFQGYYTTFEAKALTSSNNSFATEVFKSNPLVAIQHDGDLSKIEDNTKFNSIISHEEMTMNEKYKPEYTSKVHAFLFMGTNKPVKITDAKSGIIRRLIDVRPSGNKIPSKRYQTLMAQVDFELGAIAQHCLNVYREMGKNYYSSYRPLSMIFETDTFFNFVEAQYFIFKEEDGVSLSQAYEMYKQYCDEALVEFKLPRHKFREELKNYFKNFDDITRIGDRQVRSYYSGFIAKKFKNSVPAKEEKPDSLVLEETKSIFDELCAGCPAQYAKVDETPLIRWASVETTLAQIDTTKLHYVKVPENHIVIDFDLKDEKGDKSLEQNLEAASKWPPTYAEFSKGGKGIHLHYFYDGDVTKLSRIYGDDIEIKVFSGNSSLRRKLSKCNNIPIATIKSGLPLKGEKMINFDVVKSEKALRTLIKKNLNKEIHPGTKPSIDFIYKILDDAYKSGMKYDVTDMRPQIMAFANNSSHQSEYCVKLLTKMRFKSDEISEPTPYLEVNKKYSESEFEDLVFFDVEVYPNLFILDWKFYGAGKPVVRMINPSPSDVEGVLKMKLVGFNCRRYDNHIMYARYIGYDNEQLYRLSKRIIDESRSSLFGEAYNISYTDVYDFSSIKQSLKKFEIDLKIHHKEMEFPWDQPVPEDKWGLVADYCANDVLATEAVFNDRHQDFIARKILADLSGLSLNDTTQMHAAKIVFGDDRHPQDKFIYTDLSQMFPGYKFENGKSSYRGEEPSEGGYVHAEPGMYIDVALLDIASMHPTSAIEMMMFGPYTKNYEEIKEARVAIKHKEFDRAKGMLKGVLTKYLTDESQAKDLSNALKLVINLVAGLTCAKFENRFRDPRNKDNIMQKRGALFMIDLLHAVREKGFTVAHIKTDSIKIPNATLEIIQFVMDFGKKYGYKFEHEATYDKMCLVNDAVYIARYATAKKCENLYGYAPGDVKKHEGEWTATGAQFAQPYVFKTLFSKEPITFDDVCEAKSVTSALYLDTNENLGEDHDYHFIGKVGSFCPIKPGCGGGLLLREKDGKYSAATGSKGYRWLEAEVVSELGKENDVDHSYYISLVDDAVANISKFGDFEWFVAKDPEGPPWEVPCGKGEFYDCFDCPQYVRGGTVGPNSCKLGYEVLPF